jgi:hypothetical protein
MRVAKTSAPIRFGDLDRLRLQLLFEETPLEGFEKQVMKYCRWLLKMSPSDRAKHYRSLSGMAHAVRTYFGGGGIPYESECECPMCVEWYPHAERQVEKNAEGEKARRLREKMTPKPPYPSFIYLVLDEKTGCIKIGRSKNPSARERTLQSENPAHHMLFFHPGDADLEGQLHRQFAEYQVRGEWFRLSEAQIESIKRRLRNQN